MCGDTGYTYYYTQMATVQVSTVQWYVACIHVVQIYCWYDNIYVARMSPSP